MTDAHSLVAALLEDRLDEAGTSYLRVFGPEVPEAGYFYAGANPLMQFMKSRMPNVRISPTKLAHYIDRFTGLGFKFMLKHEGKIIVYSQISPRVGNEGLKAMERTLGLRAETPVIWVNNNKQRSKAGAFFYGQPDAPDAPDQPDYAKMRERPTTKDDVSFKGPTAAPAAAAPAPEEVDFGVSTDAEVIDRISNRLEKKFGEQGFAQQVEKWPTYTSQALSDYYKKKRISIEPEQIEALARWYGVALKT